MRAPLIAAEILLILVAFSACGPRLRRVEPPAYASKAPPRTTGWKWFAPPSPLNQSSPFTIVPADGPPPLTHLEIGKQTLFVSDGGLGTFDGAMIRYAPELSRGLPVDGEIGASGGEWPDSAWIAIGKRDTSSTVYRFRTDRWVEDVTLRRAQAIPHHMVAYPRGRMLLLRAPYKGGRLQATAGYDLELGGPTKILGEAEHLGVVHVMRARPDGSFVLAGSSYSDIGETPSVDLEHRRPDGRVARVDTLPHSDGGGVRDLCLLDSERIIAVGLDEDGSWTLWLRDNKGWTVEKLPVRTETAACSIDGGVFAAGGNAAWMRAGPKTYERLALPDARASVMHMWSGESGALWILTDTHTLLRMPLPSPA